MIPRALERFVELVNRGEFWESHEVLEGPWRSNRSEFLQGLILYASAFVHAQRGNRHGVEAQFAKAEAKLAPYPDSYLGIDVARVRAHILRCREILDAHPDPGEQTRVDSIPFPALELSEARVRGDEPELQ